MKRRPVVLGVPIAVVADGSVVNGPADPDVNGPAGPVVNLGPGSRMTDGATKSWIASRRSKMHGRPNMSMAVIPAPEERQSEFAEAVVVADAAASSRPMAPAAAVLQCPIDQRMRLISDLHRCTAVASAGALSTVRSYPYGRRGGNVMGAGGQSRQCHHQDLV